MEIITRIKLKVVGESDSGRNAAIAAEMVFGDKPVSEEIAL